MFMFPQTTAIKDEEFNDSHQIVSFQQLRILIKTVHVMELFLKSPMVKFPWKFFS